MQASETKLQSIIEGTKQYVVPLFQRPYSWKKSEWETLWEDLVGLCESDNPRPHFMGSVVTMQMPGGPQGVAQFLLIDGQQRLTTIFILLAALRDVTRETQENLAEQINNTILVNTYEKDLSYYKLQPTQVDREAFYNIIRSESHKTASESDITECYKFFEKKIRHNKSPISLSKIKIIICSNLSLVSVELNTDDDPYLVFESLNAKGRPLTQADLIRNYFFMRIRSESQESIYAKYWQPMQDLLSDNLTEFIRHYLTRTGVEVKQSEVYSKIKDEIRNYMNARDVISYLKNLHAFSEYYSRFLNPNRESHKNVRKYLWRLNRLEVATVYPFLLNCYDDWMKSKITEEDFISVLKILENFIIRRFVCNVQTRGLNRIFASLHSQVSKDANLVSDNFVEKLKSALQARNYPKDSEFRNRLVDVDLYSGNRSRKGKFILESIEESFGHKEQVSFDELQIEHVMVQAIANNKAWKEELGDDWAITHDLFCHTLGNLTLTAYNQDMSDAPFKKKKQLYQISHLELNKYFQSKTSWRQEDIKERGNYLADIALQIWSYFGSDSAQLSSSSRITGTTPRILNCFGREYSVKSWRDVLENTLNTLIDLDDDYFKEINQKYPRFVGWNEKEFRSTRQLSNGAFVEVNLSSDNIYTFCLKAIEATDLSVDDWNVQTQKSKS